MDGAGHLFEIIISGLVAFVGWFVRMVHADVQRTKEDLSGFKTHVATNHPTHDSIEKRFDRVEDKIDKLSDQIAALFKK